MMSYKVIGILIALIQFSLLIPASAAQRPESYKEYQSSLGRSNILFTSLDRENYSKFTILDNIINIEGKYLNTIPKDIYFSGSNMVGYKKSLNIKSDGSFTAALSGTPAGDFAKIVISFANDSIATYRVEYNGGWFFGDNGLSEKSAKAMFNGVVLTSEITAVYTDENPDIKEIERTLEEVRRISDSVTYGLTDDYQKARALSNWVSENIYYDIDASRGIITEANVSLKGTLASRRSICGGFAGLYAALLESIGLETLNLKGGVMTLSGSNGAVCDYQDLPYVTVVHEWVAFWYEKENRWVYTDPCWDSSNRYENGRYKKGITAIKYFDISPLAFSQDHRVDSAQSRKYFDVPDSFAPSKSGADPSEIEAKPVYKSPEVQPETDAVSVQSIFPIIKNSEKEDNGEAPLYAAACVLGGLIAIMFIIILRNKFKN
ncbi:MAG: transglutaminase-like domain-containing protein [Eubacterium sp.]|jgi:hypothetical protein|nr:transglutaminase-like domain-containing protein [Eubacterium sp.]